jgi:hypothetical protein
MDSEDETPPSSEAVSNAAFAAPEFLRNYVANVEGYIRILPVIVAVMGVVGRSAFEILDKDFNISNFKSDPALVSKLPTSKLAELGQALDYSRHFHHGSQRLPSIILTAIIAEFEVLLAEIVRWAFRQKPDLIRQIDKKIAVPELDSFSDLGELKQAFVEREIDDLLRRSPRDQIAFVETFFKIELLLKIFDEHPHFFEAFERRNMYLLNLCE